MINLEKVYLNNKIVYKEPLGNKTDCPDIEYDVEKECEGMIEEVSIRIANGNILKETHFYTNKKLQLNTLIKEKSSTEFLKIFDLNRMATKNFGIYTYIAKKA